jgi:putative peptide zinc metalloprotease protein
MDFALPRLRDDAVIRRFDGGSGEARHIVAVGARHYVASELVVALLELTRDCDDVEALSRALSRRFERSFTPQEIGEVLRTRIPAALFRADAEVPLEGPLHVRLRLFRGETLAPLLRLGARLFARGLAPPLGAALVALHATIAVALWRSGLEHAPQASLAGAFVLILPGIALHELGHLSACHRYGAPHGGFGLGLYWFLPVLYAEVHGAWLLPRARRAVVDVAGIYFQGLYLLVIAGVCLLVPADGRLSATLQLALWGSYFLVLNTLNPVLKYDGYWLLSDVSGSYNLHRRMREGARRCWGALRRRPGAHWPRARECLLLGAFLALATAYFAYVFRFTAHNLAYAASHVSGARSALQLVSGASGVVLAAAFALGISLMLARALREVIDAGPQSTSRSGHHAR